MTETAAPPQRHLIVFDGAAWFVRRVASIEYDLHYDETVYRCDKTLGGYATLADVPEVIALDERSETLADQLVQETNAANKIIAYLEDLLDRCARERDALLLDSARAEQRNVDAFATERLACSVACRHDACGAYRVAASAIRAQGEKT